MTTATAMTTTARVTPSAPPPPQHHIPGLDGLRGLAVAAVVVYHLWPSMLPAGFLGVTLFFALSGYLITTLLLAEIDTTGRVSLAAFWSRRLRRLMPASWLVLTVVLTVWVLAGWSTEAIRHDVLWSALHVANWARIASAEAYGVSPEASPVLHFWSLSIEEQCYLALPLVVAMAARRRRVGVALGAGAVLSLVGVWWAWADPVRSYFSTVTRGGELIAGALVAVVMRRRPQVGGRRTDAVAIVGLVLLAVAARATSLDTPAYSRGGLLLIGVLAATTVAAIGTSSQVGRLLDIRPLAWLGSVSYAVYLIHWPLLVGLRRAGIAASQAPWFALGATLVLATLSGRYVERPIRARRLFSNRAGAVAIAALVALVVAATVLPDTSATAVFDADRAIALAEQRRSQVTPAADPSPPASAPIAGPAPAEPASASAVPTSTAVPPDRPVRYGWVSDSTGLALVLGARSPDGFELAGWWTQMGCPLGRGGRVRSASTGSAVWTTAEKGCGWQSSLAAQLPPGGVDVALVALGRWDVADRQVPVLGDGWTTLDDPAYEAWLRTEMRALTDHLHRSGVSTVVWLTLPSDDRHAPRARVDRFNELLLDVADDAAAGRIEVIDLAGWLESTGERDRLLPDGVHATYEPDGGTADEIGRRFLFPELERLLDG